MKHFIILSLTLCLIGRFDAARIQMRPLAAARARAAAKERIVDVAQPKSALIEADEEEQRSLLAARGGKGFKKFVKDTGRAFGDTIFHPQNVRGIGGGIARSGTTEFVGRTTRKTVTNAVSTTRSVVVSATKAVARWATVSWDVTRKAVSRVSKAAVHFAKDMYEALAKFADCMDLRKLMLRLLFGGKPGIDAENSEVSITLSKNPKLVTRIVPTLGSGNDISWQYGPTQKDDITVSSRASVTFAPVLQLVVEPVSGKVSLHFSGEVAVQASVHVTAEKSYTWDHKELFPKTPMLVTGCAPVFCVTLMVQGLVQLQVTAELAGTVGASVSARVGVQGDIELDMHDGKTEATISAGKLTHRETLDYESSFKGTISLTVGPIFTVLPTPGAPITLQPFIKAEIKAYAQSFNGQHCGKAGVNVYADPSVKALGLPEYIEVDSGLMEDAIIQEVTKLPFTMQSELADMFMSCLKIPGASNLKSVLNGVMKKSSNLIAKAIPNFKIAFRSPVTLFERSACFNVVSTFLPSGATCGSYNIGC